MLTFLRRLIFKAKPLILIYLFSLLLIVIISVLHKNVSLNLTEYFGKLLLINFFIFIGIEVQMFILLYFNKSLLIEIYSTLLILFGIIGLLVFTINTYSFEDKLALLSIMLTICCSGFLNRFIVSKLNMSFIRTANKARKHIKDKEKIVI